MSMEAAFLADIVSRPEDDVPRLVYADWLDDTGDPNRAEFIRAQCELARPRIAGGMTRRRALAKRVKELFLKHGKQWASQYGSWCHGILKYWERGFPVTASASGSLAEAADRFPTICSATPVRELRVVFHGMRRGEGAKLAACADLARLRSLEVFGQGWDRDTALEVEEMADLLRSPNLVNLSRLDLVQVGVGEAGFRAILSLARLRVLNLYSTGLDDSAARLLCRSPLASELTELRLGGFTATAARAVAQTPAFAGLRVLDFDNSTIGDSGARHVAGAAHLSDLRELRLHNCGIRNAGAAALAASTHLKGLRMLVLSRNAVLGPGVQALIDSPTLSRSLDLDLWDNHVADYTEEIRRALRDRFRRVNFARSH